MGSTSPQTTERKVFEYLWIKAKHSLRRFQHQQVIPQATTHQPFNATCSNQRPQPPQGYKNNEEWNTDKRKVTKSNRYWDKPGHRGWTKTEIKLKKWLHRRNHRNRWNDQSTTPIWSFKTVLAQDTQPVITATRELEHLFIEVFYAKNKAPKTTNSSRRVSWKSTKLS